MTVREWFRGARASYVPSCAEEQHLVTAVRQGDWPATEFWLLLYRSHLVEPLEGRNGHRWRLDGYFWRCRHCGADVPSLDIDETAPDDSHFTDDCQCRACRPCPGRLS